MDVKAVIKEAESRIINKFQSCTFFTERDIVWTYQTILSEVISKSLSNCKVYNDYGLLTGKNRSRSTDIVIVERASEEIGIVEAASKEKGIVAIEFKYEPNRNRTDIPRKKFPVISWSSYLKDIERVKECIDNSKAESGIAYLFDEGSRYFKRVSEIEGNVAIIEMGTRGRLIKYTT